MTNLESIPAPDPSVPDADFMRLLVEVDPEEYPGDASDLMDRACVVIAKLMQEVIELHQAVRDAQSSATASEKHLEIANKLWRICLAEDFPWSDGSTQDNLTELGLLYAKDMSSPADDSSDYCDKCDGDCGTCYRAVKRIEDAAAATGETK